MRIRQRVGRNIITSICYMNIVLIYHICDVIKRMRKYAWSDVPRSSIRFTYSSVARHIGPCICHNSQTYTWNDVIRYKGRMIRVFYRRPTCFRRFLRSSSGAHNCTYSFRYCQLIVLLAAIVEEMELHLFHGGS